MEKVTGIGRLFFRAKEPENLAKWYNDHLGVELNPQSHDDMPWITSSRPHSISTVPAG